MLLREATRNKNNQELVKASIDALIEALEAGHSEALSAYLTAMSQFHNYSFQNILLIASQRPTATKVAGIRSWNELGRRVKRGEKGIMIFAPMIGYKRNATEANQSQQSDARTDKPEPRLVGFRAVYVFDVDQTEGAELPALGSTFAGEVGDKLDKLAAFTDRSGNQTGIFRQDCTREGNVLRRPDSHSSRHGTIRDAGNFCA